MSELEPDMKKTYLKPDMQIVQLLHHHQLLAGSLTSTSTNLDEEDDFEIDDTPQDIWGR